MVNLTIKKIIKKSILVGLCSVSLLSASLEPQAQTPTNSGQASQQTSQSPTNLQETPTEKSLPILSEKLVKERLAALPELKAKLEQLQKRNNADLFLIFNEKLFTNLLTELTKNKFNLGNLFDVTVVNPHMVFLNGLALAQVQAELTSTNPLISVTTKLNITAKLLVEQDEKNSLFAKFQIIDVQNANSSNTTTSPLPTALSAEQLEKLLPPVKLPLELDFDRIIPADKYTQTKPLAYELSTESRRIRGRFKIIELFPLNNRLVLLAKVQDLSITQGQAETKPKVKAPVPKLSPVNFIQQNIDKTNTSTNDLDKQIEELSANLVSKTDFSIAVKRYFLDTLADQFAQVSTRDLIIKLMHSRVMSSKSDLGFAKYENYLDIENGDGALDLRDAEIQEIKNGQIRLYVDAAGQIQAQAKGKQLNFNYDANPQIAVSLRDQIAFTFEQSGQDFQLKPVPKKINVHLDIKVPVQMIGRDVNTSQNVSVDVASVVKPITLPKIISTNLSLPKETQIITLTDVNYKAENNELLFGANLSFTVKNIPKDAPKEEKKTPIPQ